MWSRFLARTAVLKTLLVLLTSFGAAQMVVAQTTIRFDELPNNEPVGDLYLNRYGVRFSCGNCYFPVVVHTEQDCGFCSTTSLPNFITTYPDTFGKLTVDFQYPVSNLTFYMIGINHFFSHFANIDVYRNNVFHGTFQIFGNGTRTVGYTLGSMTDISKIVITGPADGNGIRGFDDFTFTVPWKIRISSPHINGFIDGTTQNALLGANITLLGTAEPSGFSNGSYSWNITGPHALVSSNSTSSSVTFRATDVGAVTARLTYTKDGVQKVGTVNINSILPTLSSFTAEQGSDFVTSAGQCNAPDLFTWYRLGCSPNRAIDFTTQVNAPTFISNPAQSGIKFVQAVSAFRKRTGIGLRCIGIRKTDSDIESGWQRDGPDPYDPGGYPPMFFSAGNNLTMTTVDFPKNNLTFVQSYDFTESLYVDDQFWMYVIYFAGDSASNPVIQRPLGQLRWNWGGLVVFDRVGPGVWAHNRRSTNAIPQPRPGGPATSTVNMQGQLSLADVPCPGHLLLTENRIDSSRTQVKWFYVDLLGRSPDPSGWDDWTSVIAQCLFDLGCIQNTRANTALGFFFSGEFMQRIAPTDPLMANPPGTPNFNAAAYNPRFVYWCYRLFLGREPDQPSWDSWTNFLNSTGNYSHVVFSFIYSTEYRSRPFS